MIDLSVNKLNKYYGENHILKGITFEVYKGQKVGLLGRNGAGKTTLFKIIAGLEEYESGNVFVSGKDRIGVLDQIPHYPMDFTTNDVLKTAFERQYELKKKMRELEKALEHTQDEYILRQYGEIQTEFEESGGYDIENKILKACNGLDIGSGMINMNFNSLSGGEKTRVNLARIILKDTDILLLDEPTNHLDIKSVEWLEDFLEKYRGTIISISHDRCFLDKVVKRIIEIKDGKEELYEGNYSFYINERDTRFQNQLKEYEKEQKEIKRLEDAAKKMHGWANNADNPDLHKRAFAMEKRIERIDKTEKPVVSKAISATFQEKNFSGHEVIVLNNVAKIFNDRTIIDGINLLIGKNERIAIIGNNGCGKTTLIKIMTGELMPDSGVSKLGNSIKYATLQQNIIFDDPKLSVLDTIRYTFEISEGAARNMLASFNFRGKEVFKIVEALSGGEKSRLRLCIIMQQNINLLILDEPTNHLDISSREWIEDVVSKFNGTILFVSHDRYFINRFATRILEMDQGKIMDFKGTFQEFREFKIRNEASQESHIVKNNNIKANRDVRKTPDRKYNSNKDQEIEYSILEIENKIIGLDREMEMIVCDHELLNSLYEEKEKLLKEVELLYEEWGIL